MPEKMKALCISDFNIENFSALLRTDKSTPKVEVETAPFGQVTNLLLEAAAPCWGAEWDFLVVWTTPDGVLEGFRKLLAGETYNSIGLEREIDDFAGALEDAAQRARYVFVPTWVTPLLHQGRGLADLRRDGVERTLWRSNLRLLDRLDNVKRIIPLNSLPWFRMAGDKAFNARLWYGGKIPFANEVFREAARDLKSALRGLAGRSRKLIILDLDDILWGGLVGEDGWEHIQLGGHDSAGEALVDFQRELKALTRRGIILGIVSKNDEAIALEAIEKHPEMILRLKDFAGWRINWNDKAQNIAELVSSLKLGTDAVVFIDDSVMERARVRDTFPQLLVPEWPTDKRLYPAALLGLDCFNAPALSEEDKHRANMYAQDRNRVQLRNRVGSVDEWLANLGLRVTVDRVHEPNLSRAVQLFNKTNQLNLSTRRLSETELLDWAASPSRQLWIFRVNDKFGDSGLAGILSLEGDNGSARIVDFILSCRVIGRKIEETMLHVGVKSAQCGGYRHIQAVYNATPKNKPCLDFFRRSGFKEEPPGVFNWDLGFDYPLPTQVFLEYASRPTAIVPNSATQEAFPV